MIESQDRILPHQGNYHTLSRILIMAFVFRTQVVAESSLQGEYSKLRMVNQSLCQWAKIHHVGSILISVRDKADGSPFFSKGVCCLGLIKIKSNKIKSKEMKFRQGSAREGRHRLVDFQDTYSLELQLMAWKTKLLASNPCSTDGEHHPMPSIQTACSRIHHKVRVCHGQAGEKEQSP